MKTITIKKYIRILIGMLAVGVMVLAFVLIYVLNITTDKNVDYRKLRIDTSELFYYLEQSEGQNTKEIKQVCKENQLYLIMVGLNQKIIFSEGQINKSPIQKSEDAFELKTLTGTICGVDDLNHAFCNTPIVIEKKDGTKEQIGTAIAYAPIKNYYHKPTEYVFFSGFILCSWVVIMNLLFLLYRHLKQYVIQPINTLHKEVELILHGEMDQPLKYDFDDEIGLLCRDTELLRSELYTAKKRGEILREKEKTLLACISHDLKTPLFAISSYTEGIRDGIVDTPEELARYSNIILNRVQVMEKLINDIMEHSKAEMQELSIQKQSIYSDEYFAPLLESIRGDLATHGEKLFTSAIPKCSLMIDPMRIEQVLFNLVSNAMKYSDYRSDIHIDFSIVKQQQAEGLLVNVKDEGKGISASDLPFVFDKFYRGEKARTSDIPGSGLGLNIAQYIIEQHGGKIECDSIVGKGTVVSFWLPL